MRLEVVIEKKGPDRYAGHIPAIPGVEAMGRTREEVLERLKEGARDWFVRQASAEGSGFDPSAFDPMEDRVHAEGIRHRDLLRALRNPETVTKYRDLDHCMMCRARGVNAAGLCTTCTARLDGDEARLVERWEAGLGP